MTMNISITALATALLTLAALNRGAADTPSLGYELKVTAEMKKAFQGSDSIEIQKITGTSAKFQVGDTYRVIGICHQQSLKHATLYVGNTAEPGPEAIIATTGSSLSKSLRDPHT